MQFNIFKVIDAHYHITYHFTVSFFVAIVYITSSQGWAPRVLSLILLPVWMFCIVCFCACIIMYVFLCVVCVYLYIYLVGLVGYLSDF